MTADGTTSEESQAADAKVRATLVGATSVRPVGEIYDYSLTSRIARDLSRGGWKTLP